MEAMRRWSLVCAVAPVAWGSNYYVMHEFLPADHPLWGAVLRALPAGLLLLALRPRLPRGAWWWRAGLLGVLNVGAFFVLIYIAAQVLPISMASTIMAASPLAMMVVAWAVVGERPAVVPVLGALVGIGGVWLMLGPADARPIGVLASVSAMVLSSVGYVLAKRSSGEVDLLASTSWQLVAGGVLLVPVAVGVEGAPPALDGAALVGFAYVTVVATALAFVAWFAGLKHLRTSTVALVGLLNPVTGVLLGTLVAGEVLAPRQLAGIALVLVGVAAGQVARPMLARAGTGRSPLLSRER